MYGASIFGNIIVIIAESINNDNQTRWMLQHMLRFDMGLLPDT